MANILDQELQRFDLLQYREAFLDEGPSDGPAGGGRALGEGSGEGWWFG